MARMLRLGPTGRVATRLIPLAVAALVVAAAVVLPTAQPAAAAMDPSFEVTCYPTAMAPNDPIVFPGQAGRSHMHTFYGAKSPNQSTTVMELLAQPTSQCGSHYDTVDRSAYWIPTLYQNGRPVYSESGSYQLRAYYKRAGGPGGARVAQAFPRGLEMIAGDMHATTPQDHVTYVCAKTQDPGTQRGGIHEFMSCDSDETLVAKLVFPDCWDGRELDSADHKSHMAYSRGARGDCPSDHPVKLPQLTFEAWFYGVNGPATSFRWASSGAYTFHGDVISAWDAKAAANLVNQCINVAYDCNPLMYTDIAKGPVSQQQIDAQLVSATTPSAVSSAGSEPTPSPSPSASATSAAAQHPSDDMSGMPMSEMPSDKASSPSADARAIPSTIALVGAIAVVLAALVLIPIAIVRRRRAAKIPPQ